MYSHLLCSESMVNRPHGPTRFFGPFCFCFWTKDRTNRPSLPVSECHPLFFSLLSHSDPLFPQVTPTRVVPHGRLVGVRLQHTHVESDIRDPTGHRPPTLRLDSLRVLTTLTSPIVVVITRQIIWDGEHEAPLVPTDATVYLCVHTTNPSPRPKNPDAQGLTL